MKRSIREKSYDLAANDKFNLHKSSDKNNLHESLEKKKKPNLKTFEHCRDH